MYNRINMSHVFVLDQDEALDFYVNKLGLEVSVLGMRAGHYARKRTWSACSKSPTSRRH